MKTKLFICIALLALSACNSSEVSKLKTQLNQDSVIIAQGKEKDSTIVAYTDAMMHIQQKLDSIKMRERILTISSSAERHVSSTSSIANDINTLDALILNYNRQINSLSARLKKSEKKDAGLEKIVANLTSELNDKAIEITTISSALGLTSDSMRALTSRFNDSLGLIKQQRSQISAMTAEQNTVYYIVGTAKELAKEQIIDNTGGVIGIGKTKGINPNIDISKFTQADKTTLTAIALPGKFKSLITPHGGGTYRITGKGRGNADTLQILDPVFWTDSKYLVVLIK